MKKISYYLIIIVIAGLVLTSFWAYQKYFKKQGPDSLFFEVEKGSIQEVLRARGNVVSQKEFDLEFPFSEIIQNIFVKEGEEVNQGTPLIKLETIDFELEVKRLEAMLVQNQSNLDKLIIGATKEDIQLLETEVTNAQKTFDDAKINLNDVKNKAENDINQNYEDALNILDDSYLKSYNASNKANLIERTYFSGNDQESILVQQNNDSIEDSLAQTKNYLDIAKNNQTNENIDNVLIEFKNSLNKIYNSLGIIRETTESVNYRNSVSSTDKTALDTQRININTAIINVVNSQQTISSTKLINETNINTTKAKVDSAKGNFQKVQDNLAIQKAGARAEDIEIAKAQIKETESQIAVIKEKIRKSTIYAPVSAKIIKIWFEKKELFKPGQPAISLSTSGYKIQSDISELEIGKIKENNENKVLIEFDAFPGEIFKGRVVSIDPKEIIKEEDKYYRVNIYFEDFDKKIRSGMSADITINISFKDNILKIPEFTIFEEDNKEFVTVLKGNLKEKREIKIGISDGESIEIISGLNQGEIITISDD